MTAATTLPPAPARARDTETLHGVLDEMLEGLRYGTIQITVHDGRVVQIDRTERRRLDRDGLEIERK